jgi:hypothetical protein
VYAFAHGGANSQTVDRQEQAKLLQLQRDTQKTKYSFFDDKAVCAMAAAFDQACHSFRNFAHLDRVRELIAKRIIEGAKKRRARSDPPPMASSNGV